MNKKNERSKSKIMLIIGIDEGLANCGICVLRMDHREKSRLLDTALHVTKPNMPTEKRLLSIYKVIENFYRSYQRDDEEVIIATEELFMGESKSGLNNRSTTIIKTAMVYGIIALLCGQYGVKKMGIPPVTVKKRVVGSGRATKEEVMAEVRRRFSQCSSLKSDHVCDAVAIALTAIELIREKEGDAG